MQPRLAHILNGGVWHCTVALCVENVFHFASTETQRWECLKIKSVISDYLLSESIKFVCQFFFRLRRWSFLWMQWPMEFGRSCGLCASAILPTKWGLTNYAWLVVPSAVQMLELRSLSSASWYGLVIWVSVCEFVCVCVCVCALGYMLSMLAGRLVVWLTIAYTQLW